MTTTREEPRWMVERRDAALHALRRLAMPDRASHRFRFSDPARLWPGDEIAVEPARVEVETTAPEVAVGTFPVVLTRAGETLAEFLGRLATPDDPFLAWNLASFTSGAVVVIPAGARVEDPIRIRVRLGGNGTVSAVRNVIVLGRDAEARVHEIVEAADGFLNGVTEVVVADGARMAHARTVEASPGVAGFWHSRSVLGRDATLARVLALVPEGLWKDEVVTTLAGPGARADEAALILAQGNGEEAGSSEVGATHGDLRVVEDHAASHTTSRVTVRALASGRGRAVFTGQLRVREGASGSEAYEEARGLLRSPEASADLLPELEILNHDVRASHGAAVGPLDEEARHYLMSRGLSAEEAEAMLVRGFLAPVLQAMPAEMRAGRPWATLDEADGTWTDGLT